MKKNKKRKSIQSNNKEMVLSNYLEEEKIPVEKLEQDFYTEMHPFDEAINIYKSNLLYIIMDLISKEIMRLTPSQREIIIRYFFNLESKRNIAKKLKKDPSSIRDLRFRALCTLRRRLIANPYFMKLYAEYKEEDPSLSLLFEIMDELERT